MLPCGGTSAVALRPSHPDPYADLAIMRRKRADPVLFSHEVGLNST